MLSHTLPQQAQAVQNRISYMPQKFGLYEDLSVIENLNLYADLHGVPEAERQQRFDQLLKMTDLSRFTERPAGKLSGGMKQKLGLACTLVRSPDLLLLDEPTVGVDPLSRRELWQIIQTLVEQEALTVLVSTAYMDEAERCDQVYVLHEGEVLAQGTPEQIRQHADGCSYQVKIKEHHSARQLQAHFLDQHQWVVDAVPRGESVHVVVEPQLSEADKAQLFKAFEVVSVPAALEDGFMVVLRSRYRGEVADVSALQNQSGTTQLVEDQTAVIEVEKLVKQFGDFTAVASTSFKVQRGEIFGLLGPNGAGKTTTFRMLCGLLPATSGTLLVAGENLRTARASARRKVGYVAQKFSLYANLTVLENLRFFGRAYGLWGKKLKQRMQQIQEQFELTGHDHTAAGELPGGYKQRLAMAAGLIHNPDILFLDEQTSGADPLARRAFWRRITALSESGTTIIITTHFMEEAEYCDRILIQDAGERLALGTPAQVRAQAGCDSNAAMEEAFIGVIEQHRRGGKDANA